MGRHWITDRIEALTPEVSAHLALHHPAHVIGASHTHVAMVSIVEEFKNGVACVETFPLTFNEVATGAGDLEDAIETESRGRLDAHRANRRARRNAEPLASIVGARHPL